MHMVERTTYLTLYRALGCASPTRRRQKRLVCARRRQICTAMRAAAALYWEVAAFSCCALRATRPLSASNASLRSTSNPFTVRSSLVSES